jgi:hypothetical protein
MMAYEKNNAPLSDRVRFITARTNELSGRQPSTGQLESRSSDLYRLPQRMWFRRPSLDEVTPDRSE